jgi:hypothetical protein
VILVLLLSFNSLFSISSQAQAVVPTSTQSGQANSSREVKTESKAELKAEVKAIEKLANAKTAGYKTFTDESEHDLSIKRQVPLYIQQNYGDISIQGWVQDRIRIKIKKHILAANEETAQAAFKRLSLITLESAHSYDVRIGHTQGTDIVSKMRDEKQNQVVVDLEIKAPYQLGLTVVLEEGKNLDVQQWKGALTVSSKNSTVHLSKLNLQVPMQVSCANCDVSLTSSSAEGHILAGNKNVVLNNVDSTGPGVFIDSSSGEIRLEETKGKISAHSTSGRFSSLNHVGTLAFESDEGGVFVSGLRGNLEAESQSGQIMVDAEDVTDHLNLDSQKSDIQVSLPSKFEGLLDLLSLGGEIVVQFPHEPVHKRMADLYGPSSPGRVDALVGNLNAVTLHAYSKQGGVRILRKVPKR